MLLEAAKLHISARIMNSNQNSSCSVILPSENQTREFDAKLLLACVLAESGFSVFVGARHEIHNRIAHFPQSIYVAKDFRKPSERILSIISGLGHQIIAWDEEGLVQPVPQLYYQRRYTRTAISYVKHVFAWGPRNVDLMLNAPQWPGIPIHPTGNPRVDLLRPELRPLLDATASELRSKYGRFVLFNSNFASLNPAVTGVAPPMGDNASTLSPYLEGRRRLFERWKLFLPKLAATIAPLTLVVRPHPAESHTLWLDMAAESSNFKVIHEGSALSWILASEVMMHSGCTTGVESFLLGKSSISFRPEALVPISQDLPDSLSTIVESETQLMALLQDVLADRPLAISPSQHSMAESAVYALDGVLAVDRITKVMMNLIQSDKNFGSRHLFSVFQAGLRQAQKLVVSLLPDHKTSPEKNRLRYPGLSLADVDTAVKNYSTVLRRFSGTEVKHVHGQIYHISAGQQFQIAAQK